MESAEYYFSCQRRDCRRLWNPLIVYCIKGLNKIFLDDLRKKEEEVNESILSYDKVAI